MIKMYPKYKPSKVSWIGNIPQDWDLLRFKYEIKYQKGKNPKRLKTSEDLASEIYLAMDYLRGNPKQIFYVSDPEQYVKVEKNDTLLLWDGANAGEFIKSQRGILSSTMAVLSTNRLNKEYAFYFLKAFEPTLRSSTIGMGIPHVNGEELKNSILLIPSKKEQTTIVRFLDRKIAEIDKLVAQKQRLIELLEEEKKAIINQAVTRGIDPKTKLKDSGIEWIGEIPKHWALKKLRWCVTKIGSGVTPTGGASVYQTSGIPFLRSQNIYFDGLRLEELAFISEEIDEKMSNSRVLPGDVLLNITGASIGRCFYIPDDFDKGNVNQHVCIIRPISDIIRTKFLYFILRSDLGQRQIDLHQTGANREGLNFEQIKGFLLFLPSPEEQDKIIKSLEAQLIEITKTIEKVSKEIELIQEYKTVLISEAVTGKIDLRNYKLS